jgi:hypothetical protein
MHTFTYRYYSVCLILYCQEWSSGFEEAHRFLQAIPDNCLGDHHLHRHKPVCGGQHSPGEIFILHNPRRPVGSSDSGRNEQVKLKICALYQNYLGNWDAQAMTNPIALHPGLVKCDQI